MSNPFDGEEPTVQIPALVVFDVVCGGQRQELRIQDTCFRNALNTAKKYLRAWRLTSMGQGQ